uniref:Uncharacterized protein n=1 Tax=Oryza rufipogon TaxID=4529 RepID=A0A0E0P4R9_ORYRU
MSVATAAAEAEAEAEAMAALRLLAGFLWFALPIATLATGRSHPAVLDAARHQSPTSASTARCS